MKFIFLISCMLTSACSSSKKKIDFNLYTCIYYNGMVSFIVDKDTQNYTLFTNLNGSSYLYKESRQLLIKHASPFECQPKYLEGLEKFIK